MTKSVVDTLLLRELTRSRAFQVWEAWIERAAAVHGPAQFLTRAASEACSTPATHSCCVRLAGSRRRGSSVPFGLLPLLPYELD